MTTSQNGWPAGPTVKTRVIKAGPAKMSVRDGDVAVVLEYLAQQFHEHVEPLKKASCGGYNYRAVRGANALSNHASGTAIDLNWNDHVLGKEGTFSAKQVAEIRKILKTLDGVVRWGGDYSNRKDDMHFEINADAGRVAKVAKKLKAPAPPKPPTPVKPAVVKPPVAKPVVKAPAPKPVAKPAPKPAPKPKPKATYVIVKKGDSLSKIAERAGISMEKLLALNPKKKKNPDAIDIGERIRVS